MRYFLLVLLLCGCASMPIVEETKPSTTVICVPPPITTLSQDFLEMECGHYTSKNGNVYEGCYVSNRDLITLIKYVYQSKNCNDINAELNKDATFKSLDAFISEMNTLEVKK